MVDPRAKSYIIFDTNIVQFIGTKPQERSSKLLEIFEEYAGKGYRRAISVITAYESLQLVSRTKKQEIAQKLDTFAQLELSKQVLAMAAWLSDLYRLRGVPDSQIDVCDKLIAATAYLTDSLIFSSDVNDFPRPFFNEELKRNIYYKVNDKEQILSVYIFKPDEETIGKAIQELSKSNN